MNSICVLGTMTIIIFTEQNKLANIMWLPILKNFDAQARNRTGTNALKEEGLENQHYKLVYEMKRTPSW